MFVFVLFGVFLLSHGFLLDGDTQTPTDGTSINDQRYNTLMNLLMEERRSRSKLEAAVTRELLTLKKEVSNCQCGDTNSKIGTHQTNKTVNSNETRALNEDLSRLKRDYDALKVQFGELTKRNSAFESKVNQIEHNLPSVTLLQSFIDFHNETQRLEQSFQTTSNKLNTVTSILNSTKGDFIALSNKVKNTERILENKTKFLEVHQNVTESGFDQRLMTLSDKVRETVQRFDNKTKSLERSQNATTSNLRDEILREIRLVDKKLINKTANLETKQGELSTRLQQQTVILQQETDKMSKKVYLTACTANDRDVSAYSVIKFTGVKSVNGISNLNSVKNSGTFTCEKDGIYLISVYIQTDTDHTQYFVKKNGSRVAEGVTSIDGGDQTTSVTVVRHLNVNDNISVISYSNMYIYGREHVNQNEIFESERSKGWWMGKPEHRAFTGKGKKWVVSGNFTFYTAPSENLLSKDIDGVFIVHGACRFPKQFVYNGTRLSVIKHDYPISTRYSPIRHLGSRPEIYVDEPLKTYSGSGTSK